MPSEFIPAASEPPLAMISPSSTPWRSALELSLHHVELGDAASGLPFDPMR
jgi:hypothetical protein